MTDTTAAPPVSPSATSERAALRFKPTVDGHTFTYQEVTPFDPGQGFNAFAGIACIDGVAFAVLGGWANGGHWGGPSMARAAELDSTCTADSATSGPTPGRSASPTTP